MPPPGNLRNREEANEAAGNRRVGTALGFKSRPRHPVPSRVDVWSIAFPMKQVLLLLLAFLPLHSVVLLGGGTPGPAESAAPPLIKPAVSTATGLLLQPPLDLSAFTTKEFEEVSASVGPEKIRRKWTSPVTTLPPHSRSDVHGLTEAEVKAYMVEVCRLFDRGESVPISDVGLISTQEDVIRRPMYNHIAAFSNAVVRVYLLVQQTAGDKDWSYFSIVQDLTVDPPLDHFAQVIGPKVKFEGISCYKCHSSGPLAIHPARADLVSDAPLAAAISRHIADQPLSRFHFPDGEKPPDYGKPMALKFCSKCHDRDGDRLPLFRVHSHPIRILVDFGYMPPKRSLTPAEIAELKAWLDQKP
jgi:hypothetical protein